MCIRDRVNSWAVYRLAFVFFFGRRNHTLKNGIRQDRIQIKKFKTEKEIYLQTRAGPNLAIPPTIATNVALFLHTGKGISTYSQGCPTP